MYVDRVLAGGVDRLEGINTPSRGVDKTLSISQCLCVHWSVVNEYDCGVYNSK